MSFLIRPPCRAARRVFSSLPKHVAETDPCGIPRRPTWSVNELLSSYPAPSLAPETLKHLHDLSALVPPEQGTPEHGKLKAELEELIRLVEAVKMIDTEGVSTFEREDSGKQAAEINTMNDSPPRGGRSLLKHAERTRDGFYIVDADKPH
ncbi:hypothetical protein MVEN_01272300 [Mycena venus]|uniref:Glutamyl-tRNA(Gln) amidotransferase subunit F, mitochondrial n=1 Tax=Mycena venus TaxID=2733690 RepID=A0A8H6Y701_9AGAR|nr:hypothetical protein MVEN_01272300 [Mycena venus]